MDRPRVIITGGTTRPANTGPLYEKCSRFPSVVKRFTHLRLCDDDVPLIDIANADGDLSNTAVSGFCVLLLPRRAFLESADNPVGPYREFNGPLRTLVPTEYGFR